jgi:tetratricopeptide (TPR) repeat protein
MELRSLGESLQRVGELEQSRQVLQQSLQMSQRLAATDASASDISMTLLSLGNVARAQQDIPAALNFYEQVTQTAQSATTRVQAQLNRLSLLVATGQGSAAGSYWSQIPIKLDQLPLSRAAIYARISFTQSLLELTDRLEISSLPPRAIAEQLATAVQQARSLKDPRAESYALGSLGSLYERQQQWRESRDLTQQALLLAQQINATDIAYRWQWQLGRLLRVQGDIKGAIASYDAAVNSLKILRNDLVTVNRDVQFNFRDSVEPLYRQSVELLLQAEPGQPSPQTLDRARQRMEALQLAELDNFFREACLNSQSVLLDQVVDQENPTAAIFYPIILERQLDVILKLPQQPLRHHRIVLARSDAERVLAELRQAFIQPDKSKLTRQLSSQIYDWLIRPVENTLSQSGVDTLVFVLDGDFRNIPMASLYD